MIQFFRPNPGSDSESSSLKYLLMGILIVLIVGSFLLQMSLGLCPVPG